MPIARTVLRSMNECGDQKNVRPGNVQKRSGEPSKRDKGHVGRVVAKECEVFQDDGGVTSVQGDFREGDRVPTA